MGPRNNDLAEAQDLAAAWIEVGNGSQRAAVLGTADGSGRHRRSVPRRPGRRRRRLVDADRVGQRQPTFEILNSAGDSGWHSAPAEAQRRAAAWPTSSCPTVTRTTPGSRAAASTRCWSYATRTSNWRTTGTSTDFQSGAGAEWSTNVTDSSVAAFTRFLGRFSNGSAVLTLPTVPGRAYVVEFDLMIIDTWDGNSGPDYFNVDIAGSQVFHHTFSNMGGSQTYPGAPDVGGQNFGWWSSYADSIYRGIAIPFVATTTSTAIRFYDGGLEGLSNESWGIDNVGVRQPDIGLTNHVLGYGDAVLDQYQFTAEAGNELFIHTTTPGDGPGEPANTFDPYLQLYGPAGLLVALDDDSGPQNDHRNAAIPYIVPSGEAGVYTLRVLGVGSGAYTVNVAGASGTVSRLPEVIASVPAEGQRFATPPASLDLTFSQWLRVDTLDASDLTLDGGATVTGIQVIDGRTVRYLLDVPNVETTTTYAYALAAGSVLDLQGDANPAYHGTFQIDKTGPRVVAQVPTLQTSAPFTQLTFVFDEAISPVSFTTADILQFKGPGGSNLMTQLTGVNVSGNQATVTFAAQSAQGTYIMQIGPHIEDLVGNKMDQNGNGTPGRDQRLLCGDSRTAGGRFDRRRGRCP